jgi:hypothetical protein
MWLPTISNTSISSFASGATFWIHNQTRQNEPRRKGYMSYCEVWSRLLGNLHEWGLWWKRHPPIVSWCGKIRVLINASCRDDRLYLVLRNTKYRFDQDPSYTLNLEASNSVARWKIWPLEWPYAGRSQWYGNRRERGRHKYWGVILDRSQLPGYFLRTFLSGFGQNNVIPWLLAQMVRFAINSRNVIPLLDYIDFIRSGRWKTYGWRENIVPYGKYLDFASETSFLQSICENAQNVDSMMMIGRRQADVSVWFLLNVR